MTCLSGTGGSGKRTAVKIELSCGECGSNRFALNQTQTDNCEISCEECSHVIGTLAELKARVAHTVLTGLNPSKWSDAFSPWQVIEPIGCPWCVTWQIGQSERSCAVSEAASTSFFLRTVPPSSSTFSIR